MSESDTTPVPEIYREGERYIFMRQARMNADGSCPLNQLVSDEIVISPGFIYRWANGKT